MSASHTPPPSGPSAPAAAHTPPVAGEKNLPPEGNAPVSLRTTVICGAVLVLGGLIAGYGGNQFSYNSLFRDGYVRERPPGASITPPPPKKALDAYMARGARVYKSKCVTCHGPEAKGGPTYPSLVGSPWALGETERFAMIILNGLQGGASDGKNYGVMTSQAPITPEELAGVMTYVRNHFGNTTGDVVTVEMARNAFTASAARKNAGQAVNGAELTANHLKNLAGKELKADDMVDPLTLLPVATPGAAKTEEKKPEPAPVGSPQTPAPAEPQPVPAPGDPPEAPAPAAD